MRIEAGELRDSARSLLEGVGAAAPDALWKAVVEAGWPALTIPEAQGGLEQTAAEALVLYAELGRTLCGAPLLPSLMAAEVLSRCQPSPERDGWLERIAGGEPLAASLVDPSVANPIGTLELDADGRLTGSVSAVLGSEAADTLLVLSTHAALVALVPLRRKEVEVEPKATWDRTRSLADVHFDGLPLGRATILAQGPPAEPALGIGAAHLHLALAADCAGAATAILDDTVDYLKTRRQFDRPLALFQALKHRCADLKAWVDAAEALNEEAAEQAADRHDMWWCPMQAWEAKAFASTTFRRVAEEAVQLHGGIGMTAEHACHRYLKRALLNAELGLPDEACRRRIGEAVVGYEEMAA